MGIQKETYDEQVTALALQYTYVDFKRALILVSALANLTIFVTWLALSLS